MGASHEAVYVAGALLCLVWLLINLAYLATHRGQPERTGFIITTRPASLIIGAGITFVLLALAVIYLPR